MHFPIPRILPLALAAMFNFLPLSAAHAAISNDDAIIEVLTACPGTFPTQGQAQQCATQALNGLKEQGKIGNAQKGELTAIFARGTQCANHLCSFPGLYKVVSAGVDAGVSDDKITFGFGPMSPDGWYEDVMSASVVGPVVAMSLIYLDGNLQCMAGQLDTVVGQEAFPAGMSCYYGNGDNTYVLGVSKDGGASLLNNADGALPAQSYGRYNFKLYGNLGGSGSWYKLAVQFADGTVLFSDPFQKP
ncbi:hypothetical protein V8J88_00765 [Massilia sp. W12]|uniref:hypothetical protein n=1 Tax=Massilia sp. W12 TaxID=3126507 RepID=UPI0030CC3763